MVIGRKKKRAFIMDMSDTLPSDMGLSRFSKLRQAWGMTLIEVIIASLVFAITSLGSLTLFTHARGHVHRHQRRREATQLAVQALEQLKAGDYLSIPAGTQGPESIVYSGVTFSRTVTCADIGAYKDIQVDVSWTSRGQVQNIMLETSLAPQ